MFLPAAVYSSGIRWPSLKAELLIVMFPSEVSALAALSSAPAAVTAGVSMPATATAEASSLFSPCWEFCLRFIACTPSIALCREEPIGGFGSWKLAETVYPEAGR